MFDRIWLLRLHCNASKLLPPLSGQLLLLETRRLTAYLARIRIPMAARLDRRIQQRASTTMTHSLITATATAMRLATSYSPLPVD